MAPATQWATLNAELQLVKHKLSVQKHGHPRRTLLALMLPLQTAELQIKPPLHSLTLKLDRNLQLMLHVQLPPTLSAETLPPECLKPLAQRHGPPKILLYVQPMQLPIAEDPTNFLLLLLTERQELSQQQTLAVPQ